MKENKGTFNIAEWSVKHPYTIISFYLGILILAVIAIGFVIPRRMMPYVESPMVGVVTTMPGLSAEDMELYITKPIEEQLLNIKNLRYIRSTSQDGFSIVSLEFYYKTDMKKAVVDVQSLMNVVQANLPVTGANLKPSWVVAIDPLNLPVLSLQLTGDGWDKAKLREIADNEIINRLKTIKDVYSVIPFGGFRRQLQIIIDKNKLAAYGLSILDVKKAVDSFNVSRPGGILTYKANESIIRVDTRAKDIYSFMKYPIGIIKPDNAVIYLKDVAQIKDTFWEKRSAHHYVHGGKIDVGIEISVIQNPQSSSAFVVPNVLKELKKIEKDYPGIKFEIAYDNSQFVGILFKNMFEELGIAIILTGIAIFLFLGNLRGTLITLITIPTSLAMAILCLIPMGMTLNSGTLIGLLLSIGRLVDDSIIDLHSILRHLKMGKTPENAAIEGINEVRLPVLSSTFMICLALSPLLFCGGVVELMFKELVWPIILAMLASALVSFTLTSLLASKIMKPESEMENEKKMWIYPLIINPFQNFLVKLEKNYEKSLSWLLKHRFVNFTRIIATIIIGFGFYYFIGSEMMPLGDVGQAYGVLETDAGTSFKRTEEITRQIEKIIAKYPEITKVSTEIGTETMFESFSPFYTGYAVPQVNSASFMITLTDKDERKKTIWQVIDAIQKEAVSTIPGIRRFQIKEMGTDVMASSSAPIQLLVYGKDLNILNKIGDEVLKTANNIPGFYQGAVSWAMKNPCYEIKINYARALELGLTPEDISRQTYYALKGGLTDEFYRLSNIKQDTILIRYDEKDRKNIKDLENIYITSSDGKQMPLKSIASIKKRYSPTLVEHDGLRRVISLTGYYRMGQAPSMDLSMDIMMKAMSKINFPPGYGIEGRGDMTQMMDSFRRLLYGLLLALFFMFLLLVAQFRGFLQPLQMLFSLPLELSGVFFGLWLMHQWFSTVSIMAVIVLSGMDITTAILLIDMIILYRKNGMPRDEAVVKACPQRLRPILMTSIITIIVMAPVAFFPRTGMDAYSPLGTVIVFGLLTGTVLSLFDIPIMHTYIDDLIKWLNRKSSKKDSIKKDGELENTEN